MTHDDDLEAADEIARWRARANKNELCAAAVVEIRRVCAEIMGGNMAFVDDDFARCLLTLRDERDALAKDATRYRWLSGRSAQSESPRWARWEIRRWAGRAWDTLDADGCDVEVDSAMEADAAMAGKP